MSQLEPIYFSIIIPVKWKGDYLEPALHSIAKQTYPYFEVLILLDKSSIENGTVAWLQDQKIVPVTLHVSYQEFGIAENWGRIKDIDKKPYMTIMGYDDLLYPNFLEQMASSIQEHPEGSLFQAHFDLIDAKGNKMGDCKPMLSEYNASQFMEAMIRFSITQMATGYVFRSSDYNEIGGIPTQYPNIIYADIDLFLQLSLRGKVHVLPDTLFAFRWHQSTTRTSKLETLLQALNLFADQLAQWKQTTPAFANSIEFYAGDYLLKEYRSLAHSSLRLTKQERGQYSVQYFMNSFKNAYQKIYQSKPPALFNDWSWFLAWCIDEVAPLRELFRQWRNKRSKPIIL